MIATSTSLLTALAALVLVLALVWLAARAARWGGLARAGGSRRLRLVEALPIDPRRRLVLVACDGREMLLLSGPAGDLALGWLAPSPAAAPAAGDAP